MKPLFIFLFLPALLFSGVAIADPSPAELISNFRQKHGEGRVTTDTTLNRIALEQAKAMAAKDTLDHGVLGSFTSRIAPAKSGRAAENIAFGYDNFPKTLDQWIASSGHRDNLLLHNASKVGIASAKSPTSNRTYWAMVITVKAEPRPTMASKGGVWGVRVTSSSRACRLTLLGICF
jgi:hypothetical protein